MLTATFKFVGIGTKWVIDCYELPSNINKDDLLERIKSRIEEFDKTYSRFRKDSLVWQISEKKGKYIFPPDSQDFFILYEKLYQITGGKFTLLVGNLLNEAGYDYKYSLRPGKLNKVPRVEEIYKFEYPKLTIKKPYTLDFGGLGKGYLIDILAKLFEDLGIYRYCIDGGGDIFYKNKTGEPLIVGLENPDNFEQVIGIAKISEGSICASAGSRRKWDKYHHIIDPETLSSPGEIIATWVTAGNALIADAIATCLFFTPIEKLKKYFSFNYVILYKDFSVDKSPDFLGELFLKS